MPKPDATELHVNALMTQFSIAFSQDEDKFVAEKVFPGVNVDKKSDVFASFSREDFLRDEMQVRLAGDESVGGGYTVNTANTYNCLVWAFHKDVADQERDNADDPLDPDEGAARFLAQKALIKKEVQWVSNFFGTGLWTGSTTGTDLVGGTDFVQIDDVTSDPVEIINRQQEAVEEATGQWCNKLTLNRRGWNRLKNHPDILDRVKGAATPGSPAIVNRQTVAAVMELEEILVAAATRNTRQEGLTGSYSYIAGNHALLSYTPPAPALYTPSAGYTYRWTGFSGSVDGQAVSTIRMPTRKADRHEIECAFDQRVVSSVCGVFFQNFVSG